MSIDRTTTRPPAKTGFVPKGHDRILHDLQGSGAKCYLRRISMPGATLENYANNLIEVQVVKRDKFTVTVRYDTGILEMIFKHDIAGVVLPMGMEVR